MENKKIIGYMRVSSREQNQDRQRVGTSKRKNEYQELNLSKHPPQMLPTDIIRVDFPKLYKESVLEEGVSDEDTAD